MENRGLENPSSHYYCFTLVSRKTLALALHSEYNFSLSYVPQTQHSSQREIIAYVSSLCLFCFLQGRGLLFSPASLRLGHPGSPDPVLLSCVTVPGLSSPPDAPLPRL